MWTTLRRLFLVWFPVVVVCAAIYGWLAYRYWSNPPQLTRNYAAELNAPILKLPEDQRAWPTYREAIMELDADPPEAWRAATDYQTNYQDVVASQEASGYLRSREATLAKIRRASQLPCLGHVLADQPSREDKRLTARRENAENRRRAETEPLTAPSENPNLLMVMIHPTAESRTLVTALQADAALAAAENDAQRMVDDLVTLILFANHLREIPIAVNDLRAAAVFSGTLRLWGSLLEKHPELFTEERLLKLESVTRTFANGDLRPRFQVERFNFYDVVQRCYSDDGRGDGSFRPTELFNATNELSPPDAWTKLMAPLATTRFFSRRELLDEYDRLLDLIESESHRPYWQVDFSESERRLKSMLGDRRYMLIILLAMPAPGLQETFESVVQQRDAILAVSAAHRYRLKTGSWPKSLDVLVPDYLPAVPPDRITGEPLGYAVHDDRPVFYSVGFDQKDDGGAPAILVPHDASEPPTPWYWMFLRTRDQDLDGDLVLWPVEPQPED
jgi:hypothetical protein